MVESVADIVLLFEPSLEVLLADLHSSVVISLDQLSIALHLVEALGWRPAHRVLYLLLLLRELILHLLQGLVLKPCTLLLPVLEQLLLALLSLSSLLVQLGLSLFLLLALAS